MRITFKALNRHMQHVINDRYGDLARLQEQLSTGKRLLRPSDDPGDVANDLGLRTELSQLTQFKKNIDDGLAYMGVTDTAMNSMNTLFQRLRELAVQGSTATIGPQERIYIDKEVEQLTRQVIALVNTQYKGDYIFSGTQTRIKPYLVEQSKTDSLEDYSNFSMAYYNAAGMASGDTVQLFNGLDDSPITNIIPGSFRLNVAGTEYIENRDYSVDYESGAITLTNAALLQDVTPGTPNYAINQFKISFDYVTRGKDIYGSPISTVGDVKREVETGITMPINISADELLRNPNAGIEVIGTLVRFGQGLLQNDQQAIGNAIDEIDSIFSIILSAQSKNGARINRLETTLERNEGNFTYTTELFSEIEDAEMAETISKFMLTENIYNAALQSAARVIQPSLVNFL